MLRPGHLLSVLSQLAYLYLPVLLLQLEGLRRVVTDRMGGGKKGGKRGGKSEAAAQVGMYREEIAGVVADVAGIVKKECEKLMGLCVARSSQDKTEAIAELSAAVGLGVAG